MAQWKNLYEDAFTFLVWLLTAPEFKNQPELIGDISGGKRHITVTRMTVEVNVYMVIIVKFFKYVSVYVILVLVQRHVNCIKNNSDLK